MPIEAWFVDNDGFAVDKDDVDDLILDLGRQIHEAEGSRRVV
jgi:hypothetical protein